jgi:hypothetical protein
LAHVDLGCAVRIAGEPRSQLRNIDSKRLVKKIIHLDADMLAAIKKEASRVNLG